MKFLLNEQWKHSITENLRYSWHCVDCSVRRIALCSLHCRLIKDPAGELHSHRSDGSYWHPYSFRNRWSHGIISSNIQYVLNTQQDNWRQAAFNDEIIWNKIWTVSKHVLLSNGINILPICSCKWIYFAGFKRLRNALHKDVTILENNLSSTIVLYNHGLILNLNQK